MPALKGCHSTSNWVSRIFCPGNAEGGIEKIRGSGYFFKGEKAAAFQLRSPPAVEANAINLLLHVK